MSFRDPSGRITIDEIAANTDIKNLRLSNEYMQAAIKEFEEILAQAEDFSGNTGIRIRETANTMIEDIKQSILSTDEAITQIQTTVSKYKQIDTEVRNTIHSGTN